MDGILPLWKPKGLTSHDCVFKIRKLFHTKKVGHTGTLDPDVEGVLPICIGQATKIVPFLTDTKKTYIAKLKLGQATDTEDATGRVIEEKEVVYRPNVQQIEEVLPSFLGKIEQVPPMYSAVKVNGKKLYEYARANETVERPIRHVYIYELMQLSEDEQQQDTISFKVICSKGTYIRTLCVDIGKALGYPAHMAELTREATGAFSKKNTVTFATIEEGVRNKKEADLLQPIEQGLLHLDCLRVDRDTKQKVLHGQKLQYTYKLTTNPFTVMYQDELLAVYQIHPDNPEMMKPIRVFSR